MAIAWLVFPAVMAALSLGCGLLLERAAGLELPGPLLLPLGLAAVIVAAGLATMSSATAQLAVPLVVAIAVAGFGLSYPWRGRRLDGWALACGIGIFMVYAAPIVFSGTATFAGYITLDDTNTWLALTDHVMNHGRAVSELAPSTYQQVLTDYLDGGYPVGAFMVLGVGWKVTGQDVAWLFQPTIALFGAALALAIYELSSGFIARKPLRALAAFLAAQPALLVAYSLWNGIKEVTAAALIALVCVLAATTISHWRSVRGALPVAIAVAALFGVLSMAGGVWLLAPTLVVLAICTRARLAVSVRSVAAFAGLAALLSVPSIAIAQKFLRGASGNEVTSQSEVANLGHPLDILQVFGIWPATDFRVAPNDLLLTYALIGLLVAAAAVGLILSWRRQAWAVPLYLAAAAGGFGIALLLTEVGLSSPWLNAKTMAEASPAIVAAAVAGIAAVYETGRRTEAVVACAAIAVGVLWSNGLAYSNAWLAPRAQLAELEGIGNRFAGQGPTLMTEYQPYGVRHFLRQLDPEGASERRRRLIPLRTGVGLEKQQYADLDEFDLNAILVYRTIVLRRSPVQSRPPSVYHLSSRGTWYEVWQRQEPAQVILEHLSLGGPLDPAAVPSCADVLRLASRAASTGGTVAAVVRPSAPIVLELTGGSHPNSWTSTPASPGALVADGAGTFSLHVGELRAGRYGVWLGGSFRRTVTAAVDGQPVGRVRHQLNNNSQWTPLGEATLGRRGHDIVFRYDGSRFAPGSGGFPFAMGPLILSTSTADVPVTYLRPTEAASLCGKRLDWVEALGP